MFCPGTRAGSRRTCPPPPHILPYQSFYPSIAIAGVYTITVLECVAGMRSTPDCDAYTPMHMFK